MRTIIVALLMTAIAGCSSAPFKVAEFPGERRIADNDPIRVRISEADKSRIDPVLSYGRQFQAETGPVWAQVFVGEEADPLFSVESAELRYTIEAAGFAARYTYTLAGTFSFNGTDFPISASASRGFAMNINSAMRQAVELAIVDAAKQCRQIILLTQSVARGLPAEANEEHAAHH